MKFYTEMSVDTTIRKINSLYSVHKKDFSTLTDLINYIADTLNISKYDVLQALELIEVKKKNKWISVRLDENLRLSDFRKHSGVSQFTNNWRLERQKIKGSGAKSVKIVGMKVNTKKDYITFVFKSKPTYKTTMPAVDFPNKEKKKNVKAYTQEIRILDFFKWAQTKPNYQKYELTVKEIKEILQVADIQVACNCMSFQFQGMNYIVSLFNASIYPETRPPLKWNKYHHDDNFVCKHLDILLAQGLNIYINNMTQMINKYLKQKKKL